jgi:hypothetical protein
MRMGEIFFPPLQRTPDEHPLLQAGRKKFFSHPIDSSDDAEGGDDRGATEKSWKRLQ